MRLGEREHAGVQLAEHDAEAVDGVDLGSEDGDLVDVPEETLIGVLAVDVVEEALEGLGVDRGGEDERRGGNQGCQRD